MERQKVIKLMKKIGGISLIVYPLIFIVAFAMHFKSISEFFVFKLKYVQGPVEETVRMLMSSDGAMGFTIPHIVGYFAVPFMLFSALALGYVLFKKKPLTALIGTSLSSIGCIFLGGVFAAWTSFAAIANMPANQFEYAVSALSELTTMQGPLALTTYLSVLSLLGFLVLAVGLFQSRAVPRWSASLIFVGNLMIILFMDLDNWMLIGSLLMLIGMLPIALKLIKGNSTES